MGSRRIWRGMSICPKEGELHPGLIVPQLRKLGGAGAEVQTDRQNRLVTEAKHACVHLLRPVYRKASGK